MNFKRVRVGYGINPTGHVNIDRLCGWNTETITEVNEINNFMIVARAVKQLEILFMLLARLVIY